MTGHPTSETLYLFLTDDPALDSLERRAVDAHLAGCDACTSELQDLRLFVDQLRAGVGVFDYFERDGTARVTLRAAVLANYSRSAADLDVADDFVAELLARPVAEWDSLFARHPHQRTANTAARVLAEVETEMKRRPHHTLELISAADKLASHLSDTDSLPILADVWLQRSNTYRHMGDYMRSLEAALLSTEIASKLTVSDYPMGRALYAAAGALFKMTDYAGSLAKLQAAIGLLQPSGLNLPHARCLVLRATILAEQGDVAAAQREYYEVLAMFARLGDRIEEARVLANLADCDLRLTNYDAAAANARLAIERYNALNMQAEAIRSNWMLHLARLARREADALDQLHMTAAAFEGLGMLGDAGFVRLDITEELLRLEDWEQAEPIARVLVDLFTRAGVTLAKVQAIDQFRRAVELREATPDFVRQLRDYMQADDSQQPFVAPLPN
jgi:tetratricopeptide (TPR) repeat protein